eukprot:2775625-Pyramimonas_sp.AAC.1
MDARATTAHQVGGTFDEHMNAHIVTFVKNMTAHLWSHVNEQPTKLLFNATVKLTDLMVSGTEKDRQKAALRVLNSYYQLRSSTDIFGADDAAMKNAISGG